MRLATLAALIALGLPALVGASGLAFAQASDTGAAGQPAAQAAAIPAETCLGCHGNKDFAVEEPEGKTRSLFVDQDKFAHSVHGQFACVQCHTNITEVPHQKIQIQVSCVSCHDRLWETAQKEGKTNTEQYAVLTTVVDRINTFMSSIHARPSMVDQSRTNATCYDCHTAHYVYLPGTASHEEWRLNLPNTCGKCHAQELAQYATSIHGREVLQQHNPKAAVCTDCHTSHSIQNPVLSSTRLVIMKNCGSCHQEELATYLETYHGQVAALGFAYTAKCYDCHGNHAVQQVNDPRSSVYPTNRLATCRKCHANATAGFITFQPHGNANDFEHYPYIWLTAKSMAGLLIGVFAFFWTHTLLWLYRAYKERRPHGEELYVLSPAEQKKSHYMRFTIGWRVAHLVLLLSLMMLVLTGLTVFYSESGWSHVVVRAFGGPRAMGIVHRICAVIFLGDFFAHLVVMTIRLAPKWRTFRWFGPDSLVPRWQDILDIYAMFKWFLGLGPQPVFDRWTYWEKFDYWAVFWGVTIIGASGAALWFKVQVASVLPGWVFNIATIFHGEEAILAAVFLFTVHFFNNHFRPDKFPLEIVMFTGAMPLEKMKQEHQLEYERLVATGELEKHRVPAPSRSLTLGSQILGYTLIAIGLVLLILVVIGFFSG